MDKLTQKVLDQLKKRGLYEQNIEDLDTDDDDTDDDDDYVNLVMDDGQWSR